MKLGSLFAALGLALVMVQQLIVSEVSANDNDATVYVVHGIQGDNGFPVDIEVVGLGCALTGVTFGDIARQNLPAGTYELKIYVAGESSSCDGTFAVGATVNLAISENASIIAHLDQNSAATVSKFSNNVSTLDEENTRVAVVHAAAAPKVDVRLKSRNPNRELFVYDLANGEQSSATDTPANTYEVRISPTSGDTTLEHPVFRSEVELEAGTAYTAFAVGSLTNETFEILPLAIKLDGE